jgi:murein DD-endopeptidase MepM/ murein hydrolase activator NlpD
VVLLPEEGGKSRSLHLTTTRFRVAVVGGVLLAGVMLFLASTWWFLAVQARKGWALQATVDSLEAERTTVQTLAEQLDRVEAEYERIRSLFGPTAAPVAPDLWLPPTRVPGSRSVPSVPLEAQDRPTSWPLTEAGFVTQALIEGDAGDHPGVDIAVPTGSYVRAAGAGRVLRIGDDPVYGLFVVLDHGGGYESVYAHASTIFVTRGQAVRRNEVIALTGSTGRSTAPHLHFEVLLDRNPVDPLTLVEPPG